MKFEKGDVFFLTTQAVFIPSATSAWFGLDRGRTCYPGQIITFLRYEHMFSEAVYLIDGKEYNSIRSDISTYSHHVKILLTDKELFVYTLGGKLPPDIGQRALEYVLHNE